VIEGLARLRIFLSQTNHLSDRRLYELLWRDVLREAIKDLPLTAASAWHKTSQAVAAPRTPNFI
jgi:hypothetical protein